MKTSRRRVCSKSMLDETEKRTWFLFEAARGADPGGH